MRFLSLLAIVLGCLSAYLLACLLHTTSAKAQSAILPCAGSVVPGHVLIWQAPGVACDGSAGTTTASNAVAGKNAGVLSLTNPTLPLGTFPWNAIGIFSAPITQSYSELLFGFDANGNGLITLDNVGGGGSPTLNIKLNGVVFPFPGSGTGNVLGPGTTAVHDITVWNNTLGTLLADPVQLSIVFNNTQMNEYAVSAINGLSPSTEFHTVQLNQFATDALTGGVAVPNTSTVYQSNAVAAYTTSASATTNVVALYGQSRALAASAKIWGANTVCNDNGFAISSCVGMELDINISSATTTVANGLSVLGASTIAPAAGNAISIGALGSSIKWPTAGLFVGDASASNAIVIGKTVASGANIGSQAVLWNYTNGASTALAYNISVNTGQSLAVITSAGAGSASFLVDGTINIGAPHANFAILNFLDAGITKFQLFRDTSDNFAMQDNANSASFLTVTPAGILTLGESGKQVTLNGSSAVFAAPTGTPAASLCLDASNNIIKKTTTGACI